MLRRIYVRAVTVLAMLSTAATVMAQASQEVHDFPVSHANHSWENAQAASPHHNKLFVVTFDHPRRRQACWVQAFTPDKLVCGRFIGESRTFHPEQVIALIVPGDGGLRVRLLLGLNGAAGAAVWGTVVLAAACPACAVGTGIVAFLFLGAAAAVGVSDGQPDRLLYIEKGMQPGGKDNSLQPF